MNKTQIWYDEHETAILCGSFFCAGFAIACGVWDYFCTCAPVVGGVQ